MPSAAPVAQQATDIRPREGEERCGRCVDGRPMSEEAEVIGGLVQILFFQGAGELISRYLLPTLPGPVVGLVLLLAFLMRRGKINPALEAVGDAFLRYLGLLFVPASVGVVLFFPLLKAHAMVILAALLGSVVCTIASSALILRGLGRREDADE